MLRRLTLCAYPSTTRRITAELGIPPEIMELLDDPN
jgi:hypothetical protein